jgi:D-aminopeptidase
MRNAAMLCLSACIAAPVRCQARLPAAAAIDAIYAPFDRDASPGYLVGGVRDGRIVYDDGYVFANLDYDLRPSPQMVYCRIGIDAIHRGVALHAEKAGSRSTNDVRGYIPELPDHGRTRTIRPLLHHPGGLRDIAIMERRRFSVRSV